VTSGGRRGLGMVSATLLLAGNVMGMGIFYTPAGVLEAAGGPGPALLAWTLGGAMALVGGLITAECASRFPSNGGEYVYLGEALGRPVGFLSGCAAFVAGFPGSIATLAAALALTVAPEGAKQGSSVVAVGFVAALTAVALLPIRIGAGINGLVTLLGVGLLGAVIWRAPAGDGAFAGIELSGAAPPAGWSLPPRWWAWWASEPCTWPLTARSSPRRAQAPSPNGPGARCRPWAICSERTAPPWCR